MKTKTAIIYDKWFDALGGGEVVAANLATLFLELGYKVKIIIGKKVPLDSIQKKLNIDLSECEFLQNWNDEPELQRQSKNADIFINITFMDYSISKAKKNIYYCHFPTRIDWNIRDFLAQKIFLSISSLIKKNIEILNSSAPKRFHQHLAYPIWPSIQLGIPYQKKDYITKISFRIFHEEMTKKSLENLKIIPTNAIIYKKKVDIDHRSNIVKYELDLKSTTNTIFLKIEGGKNVYIINPKQLPRKGFRFFTYMLNKWEERARVGRFSNISNRLKQYDQIICHSKFVQTWIRTYWHTPSHVCYPPVNLLDGPTIKKRNIILSVGRFFTSGHGKKQDVMINAFKKLYKKNNKFNWELHLAGGLGQEASSQEYYKKLKKMSKGFPVYFHINKPREYVEELFYRSKIYWHAGGYREEQEPIKMEHFGIAPVEGISASCIPILYNGGGLPEIVETLELNQQKHTFKTVNELVKITKYWMKNQDKYRLNREKLKIFNRDSFLKRIKQIIQI